jgi:VWFA-related protein
MNTPEIISTRKIQGQIKLNKQRSFVTPLQLCYHSRVSNVKKFHPLGRSTVMNSAKLVRIVLIVSLLVSMAVVYQRNRTTFPAPASLYAQDAPQNDKPPLRRPKSAPGNEEDQESPRGKTAISVSVDLVSLQVLVTDLKGNVVTGLKPENFTIYEDNVKQQISNFSPLEANITAVLLVEYSRNISYFINEVWNAMYTFANSLRKEDWVAVVGYDMHPTILCDFTQDRQQLYEALRRFTYPAFSESNLSDALIDTLDRTQEIDGKVAVILVSTGLDTFSRHTYDEALQKCKESNASVYAISLGQNFRIRAEAAGIISNEANMDLLMADTRLKAFAEYSGGAAYFPRFETELPAIFSNISQLLRSQYSIAYASSNTNKDGKFRKIKVDVNTNLTDAKGKPLKLKVITRKGYVAKQS